MDTMETLKHSMDWMTISPRILDAHRERQLQQQAFWDEDVVLNRSDRRWKAMELYGNMDSKLQDIPLIFVICPFQSVVKGSWPFWIHLALDLPPGADSFQQGSGASPRPRMVMESCQDTQSIKEILLAFVCLHSEMGLSFGTFFGSP